MPWARFEDRYPSNRKVQPLSDAAFRLDVTAICWSSEQLTDGHIPDLNQFFGFRRPEKLAGDLVQAGRWHQPDHDCTSEHCRPIASGWLIHDYLEYHFTRKRVLADRKAAKDRQKKWRERRGRDPNGRYAVTDDVTDGVSNGAGDALVTPAPPRPAPPHKGGGASPPSADGGRRPSGPPPSATFEGWCGNCSDPGRRLAIDLESGNVTQRPCPRCHPSTVRSA